MGAGVRRPKRLAVFTQAAAPKPKATGTRLRATPTWIRRPAEDIGHAVRNRGVVPRPRRRGTTYPGSVSNSYAGEHQQTGWL